MFRFSFLEAYCDSHLTNPLHRLFICLCNVSEHVNVHYFLLVFTLNAEASDRCEIRTRATEVTGALNQRLRPLGQPAMVQREIPERVVARAE